MTFSLPGFSTFKRDGLELRTNFTAQVDAELKVSQIEETITVSGASPLVDVTAATQQRTVSREVLDTVPTAKSVLGIAAFIPAVVEPPNAQDVGGSKGERSSDSVRGVSRRTLTPTICSTATRRSRCLVPTTRGGDNQRRYSTGVW